MFFVHTTEKLLIVRYRTNGAPNARSGMRGGAGSPYAFDVPRNTDKMESHNQPILIYV